MTANQHMILQILNRYENYLIMSINYCIMLKKNFAAIIDNVDDANNVTWYIGCYGENDVQQAEKFINSFDISKEKVNIFRTNNVKVNIFDKSDKVDERKTSAKKY